MCCILSNFALKKGGGAAKCKYIEKALWFKLCINKNSGWFLKYTVTIIKLISTKYLFENFLYSVYL